jgi:hypothetical protein
MHRNGTCSCRLILFWFTRIYGCLEFIQPFISGMRTLTAESRGKYAIYILYGIACRDQYNLRL